MSLESERLQPGTSQDGAGHLPRDPDGVIAHQRAALPVREPSFSLRGVLAGASIGTLICFASIYYGLQAGETNSMPLPSAIMGYVAVKPFASYMQTAYGPAENVLAMTVAASMGGIPMTAGLCGTIPALEFLVEPSDNGPLRFTLWRLMLWCLGVCLFGVVFATPFRAYFIHRSKLRFPTGTAMAIVISMLHGRSDVVEKIKLQQAGNYHMIEDSLPSQSSLRPRSISIDENMEGRDVLLVSSKPFQGPLQINHGGPLISFVLSGILALFTSFVPQSSKILIVGTYAARNWAWSIDLSLAFVGYGMIMDPTTTAHMLLGSIIGWGVLSPLAKTKGWAPGPVEDWDTGAQGWIVWVALGVILGDSLVGICWITFGMLKKRPPRIMHTRQRRYSSAPSVRLSFDSTAHNVVRGNGFQENSPLLDQRVSRSLKSSSQADSSSIEGGTLATWLIVVITSCFSITWFLFSEVLSFWHLLWSIVLIVPLGMASIRSMGETDNSLASSLGKVSQFAFALLIPRSNPNAVIASLLVGGIAEGGVYQSSDVMEHLKTAQLIGASPTGIFYGQIIGSVLGAVVSSCIYKLFTSSSVLPNDKFRVPNAQLWIATVDLLYGHGLPPGSLNFTVSAFVVSAACATIKIMAPQRKWSGYVPSGIAVGIGIYMLPAFTIPQSIGGLAHCIMKRYMRTGPLPVITYAIAFILGETAINILILILKSTGVVQA